MTTATYSQAPEELSNADYFAARKAIADQMARRLIGNLPYAQVEQVARARKAYKDAQKVYLDAVRSLEVEV